MTQEYPCPCCGYFMFSEPPNTFFICTICGWEDDQVMLMCPASAVGANPDCLIDSQQNFIKYGASAERRKDRVREPTYRDKRDPTWWPLNVPQSEVEDRKELSEMADCDEPYYWRDPKGHMIKEKYWPSQN